MFNLINSKKHAAVRGAIPVCAFIDVQTTTKSEAIFKRSLQVTRSLAQSPLDRLRKGRLLIFPTGSDMAIIIYNVYRLL
jgi:hypothetical protein